MARERKEKGWRPQWMMFDVGAFLTSDDVLDMTPVEVSGYLFLIFHQFYSEDGYLPADEEVLRKKSRLREAWPEAKRAILAKFELFGTHYSNPRCRETWEAAQYKHDAQSKGGKETAEAKRLAREEAEAKERLAASNLQPSSSPPSANGLVLSSLVSSSLTSTDLQGKEGNTPSPEALGAIEEESEVLGHGGNEELNQESTPSQKSPPRANFSQNSPRQARVQPATSPKPAPARPVLVPPSASQPSQQGEVSPKVQQERERRLREDLGWPEGVDRNEALTEVLRLYPMPQVGDYVKKQAIEALDRIAKEQGTGHWEALAYLRGRIELYASLKKSHWQSAINFLDNETYKWDEAKWRGSDDKRTEGMDYYEGLLRNSEQTGGDRAADGRTDAGVGPQSSATNLPTVRAAVGGLGHRSLINRLH